jgi:hypothetical protein
MGLPFMLLENKYIEEKINEFRTVCEETAPKKEVEFAASRSK